MTEPTNIPALEDFLAAARVDPAVRELRPDYRALPIAVDTIAPAESNAAGDCTSEGLLARAQVAGRTVLADTCVEDVPQVAAWREAYRAFGAKPQRTRNSLEALMRRAGGGLPRINRLTDIYNAISVIHRVPLGGENLTAYDGPPRLVRATGAEQFDTIADGHEVIEHPDPGEVVWRDDAGVTCRRWNWRQCRRTQLTVETTSALFILDALAPMADDALVAAGEDLVDHLRLLSADARVATRLINTSAPASTTVQEHP